MNWRRGSRWNARKNELDAIDLPAEPGDVGGELRGHRGHPVQGMVFPEGLLDAVEAGFQGRPVVSMADVVASDELEITPIRQAIEHIKAEAGQRQDQAGVDTEVTIVADQSVPFKVLKKIMLSSSNAGYGKISFAVNQM